MKRMKRTCIPVLGMAIFFASCAPESKSQLELIVDEDKKQVEITIDGSLFTAYRFGSELEKPILYPVMAHGGIVITRGYPIETRAKERIDHPHHMGASFTFGDVNGFDFWGNSSAIPGERKEHYGRILHREILQADVKRGKGVLEVKMDWVAPDTEQAEKILEEQTTFIFQSNESVRIIDRITRLTAVSKEVSFTDNKEGMLAIRVDRAFEHPSDSPLRLSDATGHPSEVEVIDNEGVTGWYTNSNGVEGIDVWGKRAEWVKLTGTKEGVNCSIVCWIILKIQSYPSCWHARGYGLFSINNMGRTIFNSDLEPFKLVLEKGETVVFRHRLVIADKDLSNSEIEDLRSGFIQE